MESKKETTMKKVFERFLELAKEQIQNERARKMLDSRIIGYPVTKVEFAGVKCNLLQFYYLLTERVYKEKVEDKIDLEEFGLVKVFIKLSGNIGLMLESDYEQRKGKKDKKVVDYRKLDEEIDRLLSSL